MIKTNACAGTLESSDIYVEVQPLAEGSGIQLDVSSVVYEQFGKEIEAVIMQTLEELGETDVKLDFPFCAKRFAVLPLSK